MLPRSSVATSTQDFYQTLPPHVAEALKKNESQVLKCVDVRYRTYDRGRSYELQPIFKNISDTQLHLGTLYYEEKTKREGSRLGVAAFNTPLRSGETIKGKAIWFDEAVTDVYFLSLDDQPVRRHEQLQFSPVLRILASFAPCGGD